MNVASLTGRLSSRRPRPHRDLSDDASLLAELRNSFSAEFSIWDGATSVRRHAGPTFSSLAKCLTAERILDIARTGSVRLVSDTTGLTVLALPLISHDHTTVVAAAHFVTQPSSHSSPSSAQLLEDETAFDHAWRQRQTVWEPQALLRFGQAIVAQHQADARVRELQTEFDQLSARHAACVQENRLLYAVTRNLRISRSEEELGQLAIDRLLKCVPAQAVAVHYLPVAEPGDCNYKARTQPKLLIAGDCPVAPEQLGSILDELACAVSREIIVANTTSTRARGWQADNIRQLIVVPLHEGDQLFGHVVAVNHVQDLDFGPTDEKVMASVGTLLGVHGGNRDLCRQQTELLANVVRALVSAVDAKDPYTSGHSDRVARYAVRIALEMRVNAKQINTIYMSGLLHDVGKIGIDDQVLRNPGRLSEAEFEHIKRHPQLGYQILEDIKQFADLLPAVLYHHEQWDGRGYPMGLAGDEIPQIARIMAVADAYDAMTSDRPYRAGMSDEKVDGIFRDGSGSQWDPQVVAAYFKAKEDIEDIRRRERLRFELSARSME